MKVILSNIILLLWVTNIYGQIVAGEAEFISPIESFTSLPYAGTAYIGIDIDGDDTNDIQFTLNKWVVSGLNWGKSIRAMVLNPTLDIVNPDTLPIQLAVIKHFNYGEIIDTSTGIWGVDEFVISQGGPGGPFPYTVIFKDTTYLGLTFKDQFDNDVWGWIKYGYGGVFGTPHIEFFEVGLSANFTPQVQTSLEEVEIEMPISVSPNPTRDFINVQLFQPQYTDLPYNIYSLNGKLLQTGILRASQNQIDISQLSNSTLILEINLPDNKLIIKKILKVN